MTPVGAYLLALLVTVAIEVPAYLLGLWGLHRLGRTAGSWRRLPIPGAIGVGLALNLVTHPLLWWLFSAGFAWTRVPVSLPAAEVLVAVAEGLLLFAVLRRDAALLLLVAIGANAASFGAGLVIRIACPGSA